MRNNSTHVQHLGWERSHHFLVFPIGFSRNSVSHCRWLRLRRNTVLRFYDVDFGCTGLLSLGLRNHNFEGIVLACFTFVEIHGTVHADMYSCEITLLR